MINQSLLIDLGSSLPIAAAVPDELGQASWHNLAWTQLFPTENKTDLAKLFPNAWQRIGPDIQQSILIEADLNGKPLPVEVWIWNPHSADGLWVVFARSASHWLRAERSLKDKIASLEGELEQHAQLLQKGQEFILQEREKHIGQIKVAEKIKSEFLARAGHELRTPLNAILGISHLLEGTNLDHEGVEYVHKIKKAAFALNRMVSDLLDFTDPRGEASRTRQEDINIPQLFDALQQRWEKIAAEKGLLFYSQFGPEIPSIVRGDTNGIITVLDLLIDNAIKFTNRGEVTVSIQIERLLKDTVTLEFIVRDSGIGMTETTFSHLFDPFFQGEGGYERKHGGLGIGLSLARSVTQRMGGDLRAESTEGVGSCFALTLELGAVYDERNALRGNNRVAIIDEDPVSTKAILHCLNLLGIEGTSYKSWIAFLHSGKMNQYDLAIVDGYLPEGEAATLDFQTTLAPPLVLMTNGSSLAKGQIPKPYQAILLKPLRLTEILRTVSNVLHIPNQVSVGSCLSAIPLKPELRRKILNSFRDNYVKASDDLHRLWSSGDFDGAKRMAHTLKGVSGTIGAKSLQEVSARLQESIEARHNEAVLGWLALVSLQVNEVIEEINTELSDSTPAQTQPALSQELDAKAIESAHLLLKYLRQFDPKAQDLAAELRQILQILLAPSPDVFFQLIERYIFEDAALQLDNALQHWKNPHV